MSRARHRRRAPRSSTGGPETSRSTITSGERFRAACDHRATERPPVDYLAHPESDRKLRAALAHGQGLTVSSEVSSVCDDWNDNVSFAGYGTRFPTIIEDDPCTRDLCHEYP